LPQLAQLAQLSWKGLSWMMLGWRVPDNTSKDGRGAGD
jgi:hypothetical protein